MSRDNSVSGGFVIEAPWLAVAAAVTLSCGSTLPAPETARHSHDAYEVVPYPPPSALVEIIPESPSPGAVWVDGYWAWRGRHYVWERGGWVAPAEGLRVSRWDARYLKSGELLYAPTIWRDAAGRTIEPPRFLLPAAAPPNQETAEPASMP